MRFKTITIFFLIMISLIYSVFAIQIDSGIHPIIIQNDGLTANLNYTFENIGKDWKITYCHKDYSKNYNKDKIKYDDIKVTKLKGKLKVPTSIKADKQCSFFMAENPELNDKIKLGDNSTIIIFSNNDVETISIKPLNESAFVLGWCDETIDDIYFQSFNANGASLSDSIKVDDVSGCRNEGNPIGIAVFNNSKDITEQRVVISVNHGVASDKVHTYIYTVNGTFISEIVVDTNSAGTTSGSGQINVFNETHFIMAWNDFGSTDERTKYAIYNISGNLTYNATVSNVDSGTAQDVGIAIMNGTAYMILHQILGTQDLMIDSYISGNIIVDDFVIEDSTGSFSEFDIVSLNTSYSAIAWINNTRIAYAIYDFNSNVILSGRTIDTVSSGTENIEISAINSTSFAIVYTDDSPVSKKIFIGDIYGNTLLSPTQYDDSNNEPAGITSQSNLFGFCNDNLVLVGGDDSSAFWSANQTDLSEWDGLCIDSFPNTTLINPADNTITNETLINFNCSANDDIGLSNISLYHNLSGWQLIETKSINGLSDLQSFIDTINYNNSIIWNCLSCDNLNQCSYATSNYTLTVNQTFPEVIIIPATNISITLIEPVNETNTTATTIIFRFELNTSADCDLYLNDIVENSGSFNNGTNQIIISNIVPNSYNWYLNCSNDNIYTISELWTFLIRDKPSSFILCDMDTGNSLFLIFLLLLGVVFMILPFFTKIKELLLLSGLMNSIIAIAFYFIICLAFLKYLISFVFIGLGLFFIALYFTKFDTK